MSFSECERFGQATEKKVGIPVSEQALMRRINRVLAKENRVLRKPRGKQWWKDLGDYYVVDSSSNYLLKGHVDIEEFGRELEVLSLFEVLAE